MPAMAEVQPAPMPRFASKQTQEERRYNMFLLEQYRLADEQIDDERASEEAIAFMASTKPNFVAEQRAIYNALHAQGTARQEAADAEAQLQAIVGENNASCVSYATPTNYRAGWFDDDIVDATISIVDLTSTDDEQGTNSSKDE
ncbi:Hydroxymethylglutaryl-CoA lyase, mitochondrial [Hordeum vulgare]|nr:Hydroxymethylglutaryl-CoA lyase, mitochondrial [Hordeum vulgare]